MEFAEGGDILNLVNTHKRTRKNIKEELVWKVATSIVKGLRDMHALKMIHRDIKGANVFLYANDVAKIGDLNVSKLQRNGLATTQTGTPY